MSIGPREKDVLAAICREYILSGEAVGSRSLVRRHGIQHSPATVRNVMSDLEEQGLLIKPHTSAGRIPTEVGLRFFVDRLMKVRELSEGEREQIRQRYRLSNVELQDLLREISRLLSELSKQCAVVVVPRSELSRLKRIEFVSLRPGRMLAVLVMSSGIVHNRLIHLDEELEPRELERIHYYLNELCTGLELAEVRRRVNGELNKEQTDYDELRSKALQMGSSAVAEPAEDEMLVEGQANLLDHAAGADFERMRSLLRTIEQKKTVLRLLDRTVEAEGVRVFIGAETQEETLAGVSLVAASYGGSQPLGTIGVIGPANMDYPRVLPLVDYGASILTDVLDE